MSDDAYLPIAQDSVVEGLSPSDRRRAVLEKVTDHLQVGVAAVVVFAPTRRTAHIFEDGPPRNLKASKALQLPEILGDFEVKVGLCFDLT